MFERIQKIIANSGICSRREAEELIDSGLVIVNGRQVKLGDKADLEKDEISVNGAKLKPEKEKKVYLAINKPAGYITTAKDEYGRKKVLDLVLVPERVFPVGRLDSNASGLLFLTNDGDWANRVAHPKYNVEKEYFVKLDKELRDEHRKDIERGIKLTDGYIKGKIVRMKRKEINIVIHEGRNKIIKRIFGALGYNVEGLIRVRIGSIRLDDLKKGRYRFLKKFEIAEFQPKSGPEGLIKKRITTTDRIIKPFKKQTPQSVNHKKDF